MKNTKKYASVFMAAILAASLAGCSSSAAESASEAEDTVAVTETEETAEATETVEVVQQETITTTYTAAANGELDGSSMFTDRDLRQTADVSDAEYVTVSDNSSYTITEEGVYVFSGSASEYQIVVEADDTAKVQIVLNGVTVTNSSTPVIYVKSADKVFVTTTDSGNSLSVTGTFTADGETNTDAVIFSKDDLVLNGTGTLTISSTGNGVTSKDDLKVTGGTYVISADGHGLEANDLVAIADGNFTITSGKDGIHCENDDDLTIGNIYIAGGTFEIDAASDGIQSISVLQIDGGTFAISAGEALESTYVQINGGTYDIYSTDDGINATYKSSAYSPLIEINDGTITISMAQGDTDAIDTNGSLSVTGGYIDITAQSAFDIDGNIQFTGGTVIVNGSQVSTITNSMMMGGIGQPGDMGQQGGMSQPGGFGGH